MPNYINELEELANNQLLPVQVLPTIGETKPGDVQTPIRASDDINVPRPLEKVSVESPAEYMRRIGFDPEQIDSPDVQGVFIIRGFAQKNRAAFETEYARILALWESGQFTSVFSRNQVMEIAAMLVGSASDKSTTKKETNP